MVSSSTSVLLLLLFFTSSFLLHLSTCSVDDDDMFPSGPERKTHLRFFFHDIVSGSNPTAVRVAEAPTTNASSTGFGAVVMFDDPLTETPDMSSKLVGRAQGIYLFPSKEVYELMMAFNFVFLEGKYNGSTLSVLGRNTVKLKVREMPIVGGSGVFRWARGIVKGHIQWYDNATGDATVEYNAYVLHH